MLLFMMGVWLLDLVVICLLLFGIGFLISWLTKKLVRKVWPAASDRKTKLLSRLTAFILSPVILIGSFTLFFYEESIQTAPKESKEEMVKNHYMMMEEDFNRLLKKGMSKTEVVELFGVTDTAQSVLVYDLSLSDEKEKFLLEITFDANGLKEFKRQR
jgi:hypothetical protein